MTDRQPSEPAASPAECKEAGRLVPVIDRHRCEGKEDCVRVCPYHVFKFDSHTGECDQPGICSIATYPVEVTDGTVFVNL